MIRLRDLLWRPRAILLALASEPKTPRSAQWLAARVRGGTSFLPALVEIGLIERCDDGTRERKPYRLTPDGAAMVQRSMGVAAVCVRCKREGVYQGGGRKPRWCKCKGLGGPFVAPAGVVVRYTFEEREPTP